MTFAKQAPIECLEDIIKVTFTPEPGTKKGLQPTLQSPQQPIITDVILLPVCYPRSGLA